MRAELEMTPRVLNESQLQHCVTYSPRLAPCLFWASIKASPSSISLWTKEMIQWVVNLMYLVRGEGN